MNLPILKYYLPASLSLKLRFYIKDLTLTHVRLEVATRDGLECLFYANTLAEDPSLLHLVCSILSWLQNYLKKTPHAIDFPLAPFSSIFMKQVLEELQKLPIGQTLYYQALAEKVGNPQAARAVGTALHKNPFPLLIPCHRIVSKRQGLGGFAYPLALKQLLLDFETTPTG